MRLTCPLCGPRDRREFYYLGAASLLDRPPPDAPAEAWDDYLHLRDNPAGVTTDLWYHETGCTAWLKVTRNTVTHAILSVDLVDPPPAPDDAPPDATPPRQADAAEPAEADRKPAGRKKKKAAT
jgi:sarcosine oxidase subunit delta